MDWKKYYTQERLKNRGNIERFIKESWEENWDTKKQEEIISKKGVLSFPHTKLESSLIPLILIIKSLQKLGIKKVIALGVLHYKDKDAIKKEFSLDGFEEISRLYSKINKLPKIKIKRIYHRKMIQNRSKENIEKYIEHLKEDSKKIKKQMDKKTVLITTGDLSHYGVGYSEKKPIKNHVQILQRKIRENLKLVYIKKDYKKFFDNSLKIKGDKISPAIILSQILGFGLKIKIFSFEMTDYSKILKSKKPTEVASVFYGVFTPSR